MQTFKAPEKKGFWKLWEKKKKKKLCVCVFFKENLHHLGHTYKTFNLEKVKILSSGKGLRKLQ